jgi:hypothetical protein
MTLTERIRSMFAAPTIETTAETVAELERALVDAEKQAKAARSDHNARALEFASVDDSTAAAKSRAKVDAADRKAQDLAAALEDARNRLAAAQSARNASAEAQAWAVAASLLSQRGASVARVQALASSLADEYLQMLDLTERAWRSLPSKPESRPQTFTAGDLRARIETFLHGASDGRLGHSPNAYVASKKPDIARVAADVAAMLLALAKEPA